MKKILLIPLFIAGCFQPDGTNTVVQDLTSIPTYQAAGTLVSGTGSVTVAWPAELTGDIGLLVMETANEAVTAPVGWLQVGGSPQGIGTAGSTSATRLTALYKRALSSSESSVMVADPGDHIVAQLITFRGCVGTGFPWDIAAGDTAASSVVVVYPNGTTSVDNTLVVEIVANSTDTTISQTSSYGNSSLANLTERVDANRTDGNGGGFSLITGEKATAGPFLHTGAGLFTASVQGRLMVALMP